MATNWPQRALVTWRVLEARASKAPQDLGWNWAKGWDAAHSAFLDYLNVSNPVFALRKHEGREALAKVLGPLDREAFYKGWNQAVFELESLILQPRSDVWLRSQFQSDLASFEGWVQGLSGADLRQISIEAAKGWTPVAPAALCAFTFPHLRAAGFEPELRPTPFCP